MTNPCSVGGRRVGHHGGAHLAGGAIPDARDGHLADRAPASAELLGAVLVPLFAAHERLVRLDRPAKPARRLVRPRVPDAVQHEPRGLLRHLEIVLELHGRHALEAGDDVVDGHRPLAEPDIAVLHRRARADAEVLAARPAPVRHRLAVFRLAGLQIAAARAAAPVRPDGALEPFDGRLLVREHGIQFVHAQVLPV